MQEQLPVIKVSVRNLVEFILRSGDIDNRISLGQRADAMQEGSRMHRKIQRRMGASYQAEVPLAIQIETAKYVLLVEGRADGIILEEQVTVDEIKGVYQNLEYLEKPIAVHKAQAMCYAYIYASQHELKEISVQMTYCNLDTEEIRRFKETFLLFDLENWFYTLIGQYAKWADFQVEWKKRMVSSSQICNFPMHTAEDRKN